MPAARWPNFAGRVPNTDLRRAGCRTDFLDPPWRAGEIHDTMRGARLPKEYVVIAAVSQAGAVYSAHMAGT